MYFVLGKAIYIVFSACYKIAILNKIGHKAIERDPMTNNPKFNLHLFQKNKPGYALDSSLQLLSI